MDREKELHVTQNKLDANYHLYFYLKTLNAALSDKYASSTKLLRNFQEILGFYNQPSNVAQLHTILQGEIQDLRSQEQKEKINEVLRAIKIPEHVTILTFALKLIQIKPFLLAKAKLVQASDNSANSMHHPLSLAADEEGKHLSYYIRVHGALLSLLFFKKVSNGSTVIIDDLNTHFAKSLANDYLAVQDLGVEANEMFMLMFSESINQSIKSLAGSSYEERIKRVLQHEGFTNVYKAHDEKDISTEYDFLFKHKENVYGLSAKRTLRERYKQFIKTAQNSTVDVMITMTLGMDLTERKAKAIRQYGVYIFVAHEIYEQYAYLHDIEGVFPASQFTLATIETLA